MHSEHQSEKNDYGESIFHQGSTGLPTRKFGTARPTSTQSSADSNICLRFAMWNQTGLTLMAEVRVTVIEAGRYDELKIALNVPDAVTES